MHDMHKARLTFIDKISSLAATPEEKTELKKYIRSFFWNHTHDRFKSIREESLNDLTTLEFEVKKQIPQSNYHLLEKYISKAKEDFLKFPPPPPPHQ